MSAAWKKNYESVEYTVIKATGPRSFVTYKVRMEYYEANCGEGPWRVEVFKIQKNGKKRRLCGCYAPIIIGSKAKTRKFAEAMINNN